MLNNEPIQLLERVGKQVIAHEPIREAAKAGLVALEVSGKGPPPEWAWLREHGEPGCIELARRFTHSGEEHLSSLQRRASL